MSDLAPALKAYLENYERRRWTIDELAGLSEPLTSGSPLPFERTTLGGTGIEVRDPDAYARQELAYIMSQYAHGELYAVELTRRQLETSVGLSPDLRRVIESLKRDEELHAAALRVYAEKRLGVFFEVSEPQRLMIETGLSFENVAYPAIGIHLAIEPLAFASLATIRPHLTDPVALDLFKRIMRDETAHMQIGEYVDQSDEGLDSQQLERWIRASVAAICEQSFPMPVYVSEFGARAPEIRRRAEASALQSKGGQRAALSFLRNVSTVPKLAHLASDVKELFNRPHDPKDFENIRRTGRAA